MKQREKFLAVAQREVGTRESGSNRTKYGKWYGLDGNSWCLMFVSWCAAEAGIPERIIPKMAYCPAAVSWFQKAGCFASGTAQPGDLIFFDPDRNGLANHVGIVEKVAAGTIYTIEGNSKDMVRRCSYALGAKEIMGYGRPAFAKEEEEKMPIGEIRIYLQDSGKTAVCSGFLQDGVHYVRLRDLEKLAPVKVDYDAASKRATIASSKQ